MSRKKQAGLPENFDFDAYAVHRRANIYDWGDEDQLEIPDEMDDLGYTVYLKFMDNRRHESWACGMYPESARQAETFSSDRKIKDNFDELPIPCQPIGDFVAYVAENIRDVLNVPEDEKLPDIKITAEYPEAAAWNTETRLADTLENPVVTFILPGTLEGGKRRFHIRKIKECLDRFTAQSEAFSSKIFKLQPDVPIEQLAEGVHKYDRRFREKHGFDQ